MGYNHSNVLNNATNASSNVSPSPSSINMVCNAVGIIAFELTDSIAASAMFSIITNILFSIVSIIGNALTIYVIAFRPGFSSFAFKGIFMISVISFFYCSVTQVLLTVIKFHVLINYHDCQLKVVTGVLVSICQCGLYTTVAALSIDRYIAVVHHQYYNVKTVHYIYATQIIITVVVWMPLIIVSFLKILPLRIYQMLASTYMLINLAIISFTYINVMIRLAKQNKNRVQQLGASMQEEELERQRRKEQRRQNSVLFIIGTHGLSMLAKAACFAIRVGLPAIYELEYHCQTSNQFLLIFEIALYPILYSWRIDTLRKEMVKTVKGKLCFSSAAEVEPNV